MMNINHDRRCVRDASLQQAKRVRTDNITEDVLNIRRSVIRAEHRLPNARADLAQQWKKWIRNKAASAAAAPVGIKQVQSTYV
jgi:hypothetical protein